MITDRVSGEMRLKMLKVLDWYVFSRAEAIATGEEPTAYDRTSTAGKLADDYASSREAAASIRSALDKHVFKRARAMLSGEEHTAYEPTSTAERFIKANASSAQRCEAMLKQLGFI
jgi:hypothetical protein